MQPSAPPLLDGEEEPSNRRPVSGSSRLLSAPDYTGSDGHAQQHRLSSTASSFVVDSSSIVIESSPAPMAYSEPVAYAEPLIVSNSNEAAVGLSTGHSGHRTTNRSASSRGSEKTFSPLFCILVVATCVGIFVLEMYEAEYTFASFQENPMFGPPIRVLIRCGAKLDCLIEQHGQSWRVFTPMWLHAGVIHLVANMGALIQLGFPLEREYGWRKIGPLYFFGGMLGTLASILFLPNSIMVGASGAVFSLLGANWADFLLYSRKCKSFTGLFLVTLLNLGLGVTPLLDNFAHVGGFIAGVLWGFVYLRRENGSCLGFCALFIASLVTLAPIIAVMAGVHLDVLCPECSKINCLPTPLWNCDSQNSFGPCEASWFQTEGLLELRCGADNSTHYVNNVTASPSHEMVVKECANVCGALCWGA